MVYLDTGAALTHHGARGRQQPEQVPAYHRADTLTLTLTCVGNVMGQWENQYSEARRQHAKGRPAGSLTDGVSGRTRKVDLVRAEQDPAELPRLCRGLGLGQPLLGHILSLHVRVKVQLVESLKKNRSSRYYAKSLDVTFVVIWCFYKQSELNRSEV